MLIGSPDKEHAHDHHDRTHSRDQVEVSIDSCADKITPFFSMVMDNLFNPSAFLQEGPRSKQSWMIASSHLETDAFKIGSNLALTELICSLNEDFCTQHKLLTELGGKGEDDHSALCRPRSTFYSNCG